ncbi:MAG TPA: RNA-binding cell elongation regulator Jag/EloR [Dehalococcoidia bacterium]
MDGVEAEGRTVSEATDKALEELGLRREQVDVEVLSEGRPRLLGFRGEPARVRVTPRPAPAVAPPVERRQPRRTAVVEEEAELEGEEEEEYEEEEEEEEGEEEEEEVEERMPPELLRQAPRPVTPVEHVPADPADVAVAVETLEELISLMGLEATVVSREPETAGDGLGMIQAVLDVEGEDLGLLIGRRGQTLASLQYLLNLMVAKKIGKRASFGVDVDGYRRRREEALINLAKRTAARVRGTGRSVTLEPMPPNERRIVHITLADDPNVMTVSIGEGEGRKVAITPTR